MWVCGPRNRAGCKPGARTVCPCLHCFTLIAILGLYSHSPLLQGTTHKRTNIVDPGSGLPAQHFLDVVATQYKSCE